MADSFNKMLNRYVSKVDDAIKENRAKLDTVRQNVDMTNPFTNLAVNTAERGQGLIEFARHPVQGVVNTGKAIVNVAKNPQVIAEGAKQWVQNPERDVLVPLDIGLGAAGVADIAANAPNILRSTNQLIKPKTTSSQVIMPQVKTNPNAVKVYDYEPKKLPTAGEYDLTSIEGMKNIQDKGLRDLLSQGDTEVQTYYHGSPNPNIDVLDPSFNERGLYGKGTYLANRSSEAVDQGMGNTLYTVETPHNQYLMDYYTSVGKQGGIPKYLADKLGLPENIVGGELYDALVERLGSKEAASKLLDDMGVKGHVVRFSDGNKYKVLYDKDSARIIDKYTRGQE